jgi:3-methyladenine DNA glycosylase AlkD
MWHTNEINKDICERLRQVGISTDEGEHIVFVNRTDMLNLSQTNNEDSAHKDILEYIRR